MTRSELVNRLQSRFPNLTIKDVTAVVDVILDAVTETLAADDRVEIRGFGSFRINYRPPRVARNPKTGERVDVPAKVAPHFKPGKELRERVETSK
jgi:integration host factor subunit beta